MTFYAVQDSQLAAVLVGFALSVIGLVVIVFHKWVKEWRDDQNSRDFPIGFGEMWTGKYTRGGLIFTYAVIIVIGAIFFILGVGLIVSAFRG